MTKFTQTATLALGLAFAGGCAAQKKADTARDTLAPGSVMAACPGLTARDNGVITPATTRPVTLAFNRGTVAVSIMDVSESVNASRCGVIAKEAMSIQCDNRPAVLNIAEADISLSPDPAIPSVARLIDTRGSYTGQISLGGVKSCTFTPM